MEKKCKKEKKVTKECFEPPKIEKVKINIGYALGACLPAGSGPNCGVPVVPHSNC